MGITFGVPVVLGLVLSTAAVAQEAKFKANGMPKVARQPEHRTPLDARTRAPVPARSSKVFSRLGKPLKSATLDQATGTIIRGPRITNRSSSNTTTSFDNNDLSGFVGCDTGSGFCEWFDAAVKGTYAGRTLGNAQGSELMNSIVFTYCSAKLTPGSGGPGGSVKLGFYEGYTTFGGAPTTTVAAFTLTGLPGNSASSSFFGGYKCFFLRVLFSPLVAFADGPMGYSWKFLDNGTGVLDPRGATLAGTWPFLSCVASCSGAILEVDQQGMTDVIDEYCPPGSLQGTFTFGTTSGSFTSMSMAVEEFVCTPPEELALELDESKGKKFCQLACFKPQGAEGKTNLSDKALAAALKEKLGTNFHSLVVLVDTCYGGGHLIELKKAFDVDAINKRVFGTSSSPWNKTSDVYVYKAEKDGKIWGTSKWTDPYMSRHKGIRDGENTNKTEADIYSLYSLAGTQDVEIRGGGDITLGKGAEKFKAILFGGSNKPDTDKERNAAFWNDMNEVRSGLIRSGWKKEDIVVYFSNGQAPDNARTAADAFAINGNASRKSLLDAITALTTGQQPIDDKTQLFLYLGMHGTPPSSNETRLILPSGIQFCGNTIDLDPLRPCESTALASEDNLTGPILELYVSAAPSLIPSGYEVYFNGSPVNGGDNFIPGGESRTEVLFQVDAGLVQTEGNQVWIRNSLPAQPSIEVEAYFSTGEIAKRAIHSLHPSMGGRRPGD
jgi:hypothetical protein